MLRALDLRLSRQNPEPEQLTRKILGSKELAACFWLFFCHDFSKTFALLELALSGRLPWRQNIPE
jgi:hypothetical protein